MKTKTDPFRTLKYSGFIFLTLLFITTAIFGGFFSQELNSLKKSIRANERQNIKLLQKIIENDIKVNAYNLIFLANHTKLHNWLTTRQAEQRTKLIRLFQNLIAETKIYDQIRFIDYDGMEKIRINYNIAHHMVVPENRLQNKAERYYFEETMNLARSARAFNPSRIPLFHCCSRGNQVQA